MVGGLTKQSWRLWTHLLRFGGVFPSLRKYYWSFVIAFSMSMFVVLYYCFNQNALTDEISSGDLNVFGVIEFEEKKAYRTLKSGPHSKEKELSSTKCNHLYEIASDMLYYGEKVPLPFETNRTRWKFRERGTLYYLNQISRQWRKSSASKFTSLHFEEYGNIKSKDIRAKKYFITFACDCCETSTEKAVNSARDRGGFDFAIVHGIDSISKNFRYTHSSILRQERGCGYWLWKPYIILKTLIESMSNKDLLMYQDAGAYLIRDAGPLLKLSQDLDPGIILFHTRFLEKVYTKRDAFILMNMDYSSVYESYQRLASFLVLQKNCQSLQFVMEWLAYASDPRILTDIDDQMGKPTLPSFRENRHDQTVLSLLSKRWHLDEFRDPTQYGNVGNIKLMHSLGPYRQLINHTRDKN